MSGIAPEALVFTGLRPVSDAAVRYWNAAVAHVRDDVLADPEVAAASLVRAEAFRLLATGLLAMFPNTALDASTDPRPVVAAGAEPAAVRRAAEFVDAHAHEPIGLADIAGAARIGARALQHSFRTHRGVSPLGYLKQVRMDRAHRDLRAADPTRGDTVSAVAARWDFAHAGRFSVDYRAAFGCSPSRTLRS
ncbi:AraC family transcriptional regulator [Actinomycetospora sp. TBRC 11914]|nr:AraC family transcriptional regulator [Actinomycetospora sp. TBRC 11914]